MKAALALLEEAVKDRPLVVTLPPPPVAKGGVSSPQKQQQQQQQSGNGGGANRVAVVAQRFLFVSETCLPVVSPVADDR